MSSFDEVWAFLQRNLKSGMNVRNWTVLKGYLGDTMTIVRVRFDYIFVDSPRAKTVQSIPRRDFEEVWKIWSEYKYGKFRRYEFNEITRFSKYIISILHWYEEERRSTAF